MNTLFLFGAGASVGSGPCQPRNPPLGKELFAELQQIECGIAAKLPGSITALFNSNFEDGMQRLEELEPNLIPPLLRLMGAYFSQFGVAPGNQYSRLVELLRNVPARKVFASLNYELLLEYAIGQSGLTFNYWQSSTEDVVRIIKPHGSCNVVADRRFEMNMANNYMANPKKDHSFIEAPPEVLLSDDAIYDYCEKHELQGSFYAPAMSNFAPGKQSRLLGQFIAEQRTAWNAEVMSADRIFVIGVAFNEPDEHIWKPLSETKAAVYIADPYPDALKAWGSSRRGELTTMVVADSFSGFVDLVPDCLQANWSR